jgi:integrase
MSQTQYLQRRYQTWYVVVEVARRLRPLLQGKPRLIRSLRTQSLQEANRLKHPEVAEFKRRLDLVAKAPDAHEAKVLAKAMGYREQFLAADPREVRDPENDETFSERGFVVDEIRSEWEWLRDRGHKELAEKFISIATADVTPVAKLPEQWLAEIKGEIAEQTRSQHKAAVKAFLKWAGDDIAIEQVTRRKAGEYLGTVLLSAGRARRTVKRQLSSLSTFWRWLVSRGLAEDNPWRDHQLGKPKQGSVRKGFPDDDLKKLLSGNYTDRYHATLQDLIRLALATGARLGELCELKPGDAEQRDDGWWITVQHGKTEAARRSVPVHQSVAGIIVRRKRDATTYLFDALEPGGPDHKRSWYVSKAFRRYREKVHIAGRLRDFHALRTTFIEVMEGAEVPEPTTKLIVGHKRASMTYGHYSKGTRVELRAAIDKLAP